MTKMDVVEEIKKKLKEINTTGFHIVHIEPGGMVDRQVNDGSIELPFSFFITAWGAPVESLQSRFLLMFH